MAPAKIDGRSEALEFRSSIRVADFTKRQPMSRATTGTENLGGIRTRINWDKPLIKARRGDLALLKGREIEVGNSRRILQLAEAGNSGKSTSSRVQTY